LYCYKKLKICACRLRAIPGKTPVIESAKILLVSDSKKASQDLVLIMSFLGEAAITCDSESWQTAVKHASSYPGEISLALIGDCKKIELPKLLNNLYEWDSGLPLVMLGQSRLRKIPEPEVLNNITAELSFPLSYQPLLDALHQAKVFRDHFNRLQSLGGIRDYNMFRSLVGNSEKIQQVRQMMGQVASKEVTVLITGESGTGKEVVARNLHSNSPRADKPFVPINCGAIPRELLESELFGHEQGAFTGAISTREGRFELADGGTLFLDDIGDMPLSMQVKLLRVLQELSFERVGGVKTISTDVRILAATHMDLEEMIASREFREDLYYRINVFPIEMPPLRDRTDDVPLLLNELISNLEAEKRGSIRFNSKAIECLMRYSWPGNVRELANLVERMAILYPHGIVGVKELPEKFRNPDETDELESDDSTNSASEEDNDSNLQSELPLEGLDLKEYLANLEKGMIERALDDSQGVVARAADRLHMRRTTLVEKIRKYSLQKDSEEDSSDTEENQSSSDSDKKTAVKKQVTSG
jgi:sigma-54 specific flagellar transcriptional regulator A